MYTCLLSWTVTPALSLGPIAQHKRKKRAQAAGGASTAVGTKSGAEFRKGFRRCTIYGGSYLRLRVGAVPRLERGVLPKKSNN